MVNDLKPGEQILHLDPNVRTISQQRSIYDTAGDWPALAGRLCCFYTVKGTHSGLFEGAIGSMAIQPIRCFGGQCREQRLSVSSVRRYFQGSWRRKRVLARRSGPQDAQLGEFDPTGAPTHPSCDFRNTSMDCGYNHLNEVVRSMLSCADGDSRPELYGLWPKG